MAGIVWEVLEIAAMGVLCCMALVFLFNGGDDL